MLNKKAYTLVEILVVLGIIIFLSAIVIAVINPNLQENRAKDAAVKKGIGDIAAALEIYKATYGRYPTTGDFSKFTPFLSSGYTVYIYGNLLAFNSSSIDTGSEVDSIYWDPTGGPSDEGCLQGQLSVGNQYVNWTPSQEVTEGGASCSDPILAALGPSGDDGPSGSGSSGSSTGTGAPVGNEFTQHVGTDPALVGYWTMDEDSGTSIADSSGKANHGTLTAGAIRDLGVSGNAMRLDSSSDYGHVPNMLGNPRSVTLIAWVNALGTSSQGGDVISIGDNAALRIRTADSYGFYHNGTNWPLTTASGSSNSVIGKGWHHVAYVFDDNANTQKLFIDGTLRATTNYEESIVYSGLGTGTTFGRHGNVTYNNYDVRGRIDEVKIYNYARTDGEIEDDYEATKLADVPNPVVYLNLNEGSGDTAADSIAPAQNGNLGSSSNCPTGTNCPTWLPSNSGKRAGAMTFDGDDHVDLGTGLSSVGTSAGTFSAWFRTTTPTLGFMIYGSADTSGDGFGGNREGHLGMTATGNVNFFMYGTPGGGSANIASPTSYADGEWHHALATWSIANGEAVLYVDGVEVASGPYSLGNFNLGTRAFLGRPTTPFGAVLRAYNGDLDEVRIFNYALSPEQADAEYRR